MVSLGMVSVVAVDGVFGSCEMGADWPLSTGKVGG